MHKNLDLDRAFLTDMRDLLRGKLPRKHDAAAPERGGLHHALKRMDAHLRGGMDGHIRCKLPAQRYHAEILHDERIDAAGCGQPDQLRRTRHLAVEHECVERQMYLDAAHMTVDNGFLQIGGGKIAGVYTRVEGIGA